MDWSKYQLRLVESYEGEDSLGNDVSGCRESCCPAASLREGEEVQWDRHRSGYPTVYCNAIGEDSITLKYTNYFNPVDRLSETREVTLTPGGRWGHGLGGGRYNYHYDLYLETKE